MQGRCREGTDVLIDASQLTGCGIPDRLMREMRSSVIFLGALLAGRLGRAELSYPGAASWGPGPSTSIWPPAELGGGDRRGAGAADLHPWKGLTGRELCLSIPSVGATENAMLAACAAQGMTTIVGAAREPEIVDLQKFLNSMGARVSGAGSPVISIQGVRPSTRRCTVMGDRIAAATYLCAVGAAGGELRLTGVEPADLAAVCCCLEEAGCRLRTDRGWAVHRRLRPDAGHPNRAHRALSRLSHRCPGHPDGGSGRGTGTTMIVENMFDSRYRHVDELARMGADIQLVSPGGRGHRKPPPRSGCAEHRPAGRGRSGGGRPGAEGVSRVSGLNHIRRGYQGLGDGLAALGADIPDQL